MPALTTLAVDDRASTPVTHTYKPMGLYDGIATFTESDGVPIGDRKITMSTKRTSAGKQKVRIVFADPVLVTESVNGVDRPKVDRSAFASVEFTFEATSTTQERKDLVGKVAHLLGSAQTFTMSVVEDLEGIYGG